MDSKVRNRIRKANSKGQAIVEYIIIIAIVAIAALTILGIFSDRVRAMISGAAKSLGASESDNDKKSVEIMKDMDANGVDFGN